MAEKEPAYRVPVSDESDVYQGDGAGYHDETAGVFNASAAAASDGPSQFGGSISSRMHAAGEQGWRDKWFLLAFLVHLIGLIAVAGVYGPTLTAAIRNNYDAQTAARDGSNDKFSEPGNRGFAQVIGILSVAAIIGAVSSALWLRLMQRLQGQVVKYSLIGNAVVVAAAVIATFAAGVWQLGLVFLFYLAVLGIWCYFIRARIPMAEATLTAASRSLLDNHGPIVVAYFMAFLLLLFSAFWAFTFTAVFFAANAQEVQPLPPNYNPNDPSTYPNTQSEPVTSGMKAAYVFLIFSMYWTSQVLANISHVTTAGMVASWWLVNDIEKPTLGAFKRACTTSLGTICAGSLVVAIIQTVVYLLRQTRGALAAVAACILNLINDLVKWFNKYALVEAAMYGLTFANSARAVKALMSARFWELLINDSLLNAVFLMGNMMSGALAGLVGGVWAASITLDAAGGIAVLSFVIGFILSSLFMIVLSSAVATTYVVWAEDPQAMLRNRPEHYNRIAAAAQGMYPAEYQEAVGARMGPVQAEQGQAQQALVY